MRGIEQVCILRLFQGGDRAGHVALVALEDVGEHRRFVDSLAPALKLQNAPPRPLFRGGGHVNLNVGLRAR